MVLKDAHPRDEVLDVMGRNSASIQSGKRVRPRRGRFSRPPRTFILPVMAAVIVFYTTPNVLQLATAFTDWSTFKSGINFTGLENFKTLVRTGDLARAVKASLTFAIAVMIFSNVYSLVLALALEKTNRLNGLFRTLFFLPVLISPIAAGHASRAIFAPDGFVNQVLSTFISPFHNEPVRFQWFGSLTWTIFIVAAVHAWKFAGIHMMIYIAALNTIPHELLEAARIEGASRWQVFRHIKFPLIAPAITVNVTLTLIGALSAFDVILATTEGGPARTTEIFNIVVFRQWGTGLLGSATAMSLSLVVVILAVAIPLLTYLRRREVEL